MGEDQKNEYGRYIPDFETLISKATCEEEVSYIRSVQETFERYKKMGYEKSSGFSFNMVYITRQKCGHFEMFQTPHNEYYTLENNLKQAEKHAIEYKCTKCICGLKFDKKEEEK